MSDIADVLNGLGEGDVATIDLSSVADEVGGAWPAGWYKGTIIEGYRAGKGYEFLTADTISKKGDSRNFRVCFRLTDGGNERTTFVSYNYRPTDFTPEKVKAIVALRAEFKGQKGKWVGYEDLQRTSLALGKLGQLQKATGQAISFTSEGAINVGPFIDKSVDVRLAIDDETGYNEVTGLAPAGEKV